VRQGNLSSGGEMSTRLRNAIAPARVAVGFTALALFVCGCITPSLDHARNSFYAGRLGKAEETLRDGKAPEKDKVLFLMERGMIRQARGDYSGSIRDFLSASDLIEYFRTYSVSKGAGSLVVNDTVQDFSGAPFERSLLHAFTAKNYLATGKWDDAAVEARRIIEVLDPDMLGDYPEDAYSRYMAGFCLEMIDDDSNAALQYRKADALLAHVAINDQTGLLSVKTTNAAPETVEQERPRSPGDLPPTELVCFVLSGRAPSGWDSVDGHVNTPSNVYAEIFCRGSYLGRSYTLADTMDLAFTTDQIEAARKAVKAATRIAVKEGIAQAVESDDELLGGLVRAILIDLLERPDFRRWETLPRWLGVARVSCPQDLADFDVVFKTPSGAFARTVHVTEPIMRRRNTFVSFCRDLAVTTGPAEP
jgi:hypothetical protein